MYPFSLMHTQCARVPELDARTVFYCTQASKILSNIQLLYSVGYFLSRFGPQNVQITLKTKNRHRYRWFTNNNWTLVHGRLRIVGASVRPSICVVARLEGVRRLYIIVVKRSRSSLRNNTNRYPAHTDGDCTMLLPYPPLVECRELAQPSSCVRRDGRVRDRGLGTIRFANVRSSRVFLVSRALANWRFSIDTVNVVPLHHILTERPTEINQ